MKSIKISAHLGELFWDLLLAAKIALGADGSTTSPTDREHLYDSVVAIEDACIKNGRFKFKNARGRKMKTLQNKTNLGKKDGMR